MYSDSAEYLPVMPTVQFEAISSESIRAHFEDHFVFTGGKTRFFEHHKVAGNAADLNGAQLVQLQRYLLVASISRPCLTSCLYLQRLLDLSATFEYIQNEVVNEGVRIVKAYEAVNDGDKIDFGAHMSHDDMLSLCNVKSGFIIWLKNDFILSPNVILPAEGDKGAAEIAKVANFLLEEGAGAVVRFHTDPEVKYSFSYFYDVDSNKMLFSEKEFLMEHWMTADSVIQWRR